MLHRLPPILLFLSCKAISNANIVHVTLALLTILAAQNIIEDSLVPFLNNVMLSLTCLMVFDLVYKTSLVVYQRSSTVANATDAMDVIDTKTLVDESWRKRPAFREIEGVFIQKTPYMGSEGIDDTTKRGIDKATDATRKCLSEVTIVTNRSLPDEDIDVLEDDTIYGRPMKLAEKAASLGKSLRPCTPAKPLREIDPGKFQEG